MGNSVQARGPLGLDHLKFIVNLLSSHDRVEVLLPKLSEEPKPAMPVVQVDQKFNAQELPDVRQRYSAMTELKSDIRVKGEDSALIGKISKGIAVKVISMCQIGGKIGVGPVWRRQSHDAAVAGYSMQFSHNGGRVANVFDDMAAHDLIEPAVWKWVGDFIKIVDHVGGRPRIDVHPYGSINLVLAATDVQYTKRRPQIFGRPIGLD